MKITPLHRFSALDGMAVVMRCDTMLKEKVKAISLPKKVFGQTPVSNTRIQLQHIIMGWNTKQENDLYTLAIRAYGLKVDWMRYMSLIDVLRLTSEFSDTLENAAKMFVSLKRELKDEELKKAMSEIKSGDRDILTEIMIASNGAYTQEQAGELSWVLAYDIIASKTRQFDQMQIQSELQEKRMKHGTKRVR